jgi:DNA-binding CsgD family transcriptional regulator
VPLALDAQRIVSNHCIGSHRRGCDHAELREGIDAAAGELRRLVHAIMRASLIERGLSAATEDVVDHMRVPTRLELGVRIGTLSSAVESTRREDDAVECLTPREQEVLTLMAQGRRNASIARQLILAEKAVVQHALRIFYALACPPATTTNDRPSSPSSNICPGEVFLRDDGFASVGCRQGAASSMRSVVQGGAR